MKTIAEAVTNMWFAVDKDGRGKIFRHRPTREQSIWTGIGGCEPEILIPDAEKQTGRTWRDEPTKEQVSIEITINTEEQ